MYLWRKSAGQKWWHANEAGLRAIACDGLAVIERSKHKRLQLEVASRSRLKLEKLARHFGGKVEKLRRDWLKRALQQKTKPIKVGKKRLMIPAAAAFGTGEHATTAMSLRLLEKVARDCDGDWSMVDLGTGTGILALAAKFLGARSVIGIDNDPTAIRIAKQNARLNRIRGVKFRVADVRCWKLPGQSRLRQGFGVQVAVVAANLFSELLIAILPNLTRADYAILSGILRGQERDVRRSLTGRKIDITDVRRRGKWVAMLVRRR